MPLLTHTLKTFINVIQRKKSQNPTITMKRPMSGSNYLGHFTRTRDAHRKNGREIGRWGDETVVLSVIRVVYVMEDPVMRSGHLSDGVYSGRAWWNEMYDARVCGEKAGLSRSDYPVEGDMDGL